MGMVALDKPGTKADTELGRGWPARGGTAARDEKHTKSY